MRLSILSFLLFLAGHTVQAQIFVKHNASGNNNGTSWANAFTDLQDALDASVPGDQVWVAAGTYVPSGPTPDSSHFWVLKSVEVYGGFAGTESNLNERDWVNNLTILSGDINGDDLEGDFFSLREDNAHHVLIVDVDTGESIIDGLLFKGGFTRTDVYAPDASDTYINRWWGGALYIKESTVTIRNSTFRDNYANRGAGIYAGGDAPLTRTISIENVLFEFNYAYLRGGGAQLSNWQLSNVFNCKFQENQSNEGGGLAIGNSNSIVKDCEFYLNLANYGGGLTVYHNTLSIIDEISVTVSKCTFNENVASEEGGGFDFINLDRGFHLALDSCTFSKNITTNPYPSGGGINIRDQQDLYQFESASSIRINQCLIQENLSRWGGGAWISAGDDSLNIQISNSIISGNEANVHGGGLDIGIYDLAIPHILLENTTFENNSALYGGGGMAFEIIYNIYRPVFVIDNCLFNNNIAGSWGGAIGSSLIDGFGSIGSIFKTQFLSNQSAGGGGAIDSYEESLHIENCLFSENYTVGTFDPPYNGGGAIAFDSHDDLTVRNTIFERNESYGEGAALIVNGETNAVFENVLFHENMGTNTLANGAKIFLLNSTMTDNEKGLFLRDSSTIEIQNSIFKNVSENLQAEGSAAVLSNGANISSDSSMIAFLLGNGSYDDLHFTDPMLGLDHIPVTGSPCIDAGNPEGIESALDLGGNPRYNGNGIDIGAFESFLVSIKDAAWETSAFNVFPNPARDILNFSLESEWNGEIRLVIYDYLGHAVHQSIQTKSGKEQSFSEELNHLTPGEYVILAKAGNQTYAANIIIQR